MNSLDFIKSRRSIRIFKPDLISADLLHDIVSTATYAPSWKNSQITRYHVICDANLKNQIASECCDERNCKIIKGAPALVIVTLVTKRSGFERDGSFSTYKKDRWQYYDSGIATATFCLSAHAHGLGTTVLGIYDNETRMKELADIPKDQETMGLLVLGFPDESPQAPTRKTSEVLLTIH
jgi:Nitroreductase